MYIDVNTSVERTWSDGRPRFSRVVLVRRRRCLLSRARAQRGAPADRSEEHVAAQVGVGYSVVCAVRSTSDIAVPSAAGGSLAGRESRC